MSSRRFSHDHTSLRLTGRQVTIVSVMKGSVLYIQDGKSLKKCKKMSVPELYSYIGRINAKVKRYHGTTRDMVLPPIKPRSVMLIGKRVLTDSIIEWNNAYGYFDFNNEAGQEVEKWLDSSGITSTMTAIDSGEYLRPYLEELQLTELRGLYVMSTMEKKALIKLLTKWFVEYELLFLEKQKL